MVVKLKSPTVHAIRIVKFIAAHEEQTLIASEISDQVHMTQTYFMRLVKDLRKAGIIGSIQGRYGGFNLSRPASQITLYDMVKAIEGDELNLEAEDMEILIKLLDEINESVTRYMKTVTISDI